MSGVQSECEKLQLPITQQCVMQLTSCLVLGWVFFSKEGLALFNFNCSRVTMYFVMIGLLLRQALDRLRVRLNMYLVLHLYLLCYYQISLQLMHCGRPTGHFEILRLKCIQVTVTWRHQSRDHSFSAYFRRQLKHFYFSCTLLEHPARSRLFYV